MTELRLIDILDKKRAVLDGSGVEFGGDGYYRIFLITICF